MPQFRKKPIEISAEQWFPGSGHKGVCWEKRTGDDGESVVPFVITAHEQRAYLAPGDWIIPEPKPDRFYPCKPDIFAATYDPVDLPVSAPATPEPRPVISFNDATADDMENSARKLEIFSGRDPHAGPTYVALAEILRAEAAKKRAG